MQKELQILLVEDSPADVRLIREVLRDTKLPHNFRFAADGDEALRHLCDCLEDGGRTLPDIIILDLNMPRVDGHQFLKRMQLEPSFRDIPVVVLTVSQDDEDVSKALSLGMNFYIRKPPCAETIGPLLERVVMLWTA